MIRKVLGLTFMVGVVSMFAFACGDDDAAAGDKYPTVDSFCTAKAKLECSAGSVGICGVTNDACTAARKTACVTAGNAAVGRSYTPAKAEACLNLVTNAYNAPNDKAKYTAYIDTCEGVFSGTKTKGQPCSNKFDCAGTLYCDLEKATPLCADKSAPKNENDGCANSGDVCATGLFCDITATPLCHKQRGVGESCALKLPCVADGYCKLNGSTGACLALSANGTACSVDAECAGNFCNKAINNGTCAGRQFPTETGTCKDLGGS
ncbi:MAG: hypothetical protein U0270_07595 [Labilithrix sp.]